MGGYKKAYRNTYEYMYICVYVYRSMELILARNVFLNLINPPKSLTLLLLLPSEGQVNDQLLSFTITVKLFALSVSRCIDSNVIVIAMTMGAISSQIKSLTVVYSTVYSDADQRKYQCSVPLAFVRGIHQGPDSFHIFPWLCVWGGCIMIVCQLYHINPKKAMSLLLLLLCGVCCVQINGLGSYSSVCTLHNPITIRMQTHVKPFMLFWCILECVS